MQAFGGGLMSADSRRERKGIDMRYLRLLMHCSPWVVCNAKGQGKAVRCWSSDSSIGSRVSPACLHEQVYLVAPECITVMTGSIAISMCLCAMLLRSAMPKPILPVGSNNSTRTCQQSTPPVGSSPIQVGRESTLSPWQVPVRV